MQARVVVRGARLGFAYAGAAPRVWTAPRAALCVPRRQRGGSGLVDRVSARLGSVLRFDKVPTKEPDWGDDDDDDDDDEYGGGGGKGRGGGGGGSGGGGGRGGGDGGDGKRGVLGVLAALWTTAVRRRPVLTKACSTMVISLLGDVCAQRVAGGPDFEWDVRRTLAVGGWGFVWAGPVLHHWYAALDRVFFGARAVWMKLAADQLLFAPFFNAAFMVGTRTLEGAGVGTAVAAMREAIWPSMKANWTLWPAAQFVNFALVPRPFQILWVNSVAFVWTIILTYITHDDAPDEDEAALAKARDDGRKTVARARR